MPAQPGNQVGRSHTQIFPGSGAFIASQTAPATTTTTTAKGNITLNFVNADIREVAKSVLGTLLGLNYEIGSDAHGTVTIQTSHPLRRADVLPAFEQALALNGLALSKSGTLYKITKSGNAQKTLRIEPAEGAGSQEPGYGVEVVPLHYIGVAAMQRLLGPLLPAKDMIQADPVRNLLFVKGSAVDRSAILDNIALFDVDWLKGMSFSLYTPQYTSARELTRELQQIIGGPDSPLKGLVRFVSIDRLNAVLAISPQEKYLKELETWTTRLDRPSKGSDRRLFVYHVQNGRAQDLASVLTKVLSDANGGSSSTSTPMPARPSADEEGSAAPQQNMSQLSAPEPVGGSLTLAGGAKVNITADETNNALVIYATPNEYQIIKGALKQLDIEPLQVMLEAAIAEVRLTKNIRYGVQYFYQPSTKHTFVLSNSKTSDIGATLPGFSYAFSEGTNIRVILDALSSVTHVQVLSSPQILVLNNQTASLQVGDQVPIVTQQAVSTLTSSAPLVNNVQYQDTGVILKVTPRVNQGGLVMMDITQQVSSVVKTTSSSIDSPTIQKRQITSTVAVKNGATIALGGLISTNATKGKDGIPYLQRIPGLGALFRSTSNENDRTELIVLITPHVVNNMDKAIAVTNELRRKLPAVEQFLTHKH